jgi:signal transduction histidine kinase
MGTRDTVDRLVPVIRAGPASNDTGEPHCLLRNVNPRARAAVSFLIAGIRHARFAWRVLLTTMVLLASIQAATAEPRRVLLLHSFGPHFAPSDQIAARLREELIKKSPDPIDLYEASLHSAIYYAIVRLDGAGIPHEPLISVDSIVDRSAAVALRIFAGEAPGSIKPATLGLGQPMYDWRELRHWNISESRRTPDSRVYFREATAWERYGWEIQAICAAMLLQAGLIAWLIYQHRRRHEAEVLARSSISELQEMNRVATASELCASIAHEVGQPLTGISALATAALQWLARDTPDLEKTRNALTDIVNASHGATELVTSVRAMFTKNPGKREPLEINALIGGVLAILRVELQSNRIEVQTQLDPTLPRVECDRVQLQQVILNLIMNAMEAMQAGPPRVLRIRTSLARPHVVNVLVEDTGSGIDAAQRDRLFKPLVTTKANGMGMGLAICQSIIASHRGRIWASAALGKGSAFQFELPTAGAVKATTSNAHPTINGARRD